ncbi:nucleolar and spindle-associated protein 1 isoform X2 [Pseudonaja textilis]|uniref:nucleolar and spindle-associated protein 1 isoform X2 n=1 Tax=Pseudonaja textilis TaxID=8673 RepID=UPI000EA9A9EE|nr:nucleolar and spindle-associated protein 1 isoform X2 [Pseudonaja textilis]
MEALSSSQLEELKYSELQCLAKSAGLKANLKAAKLLNALKKHFCEENTSIKKTFPSPNIEEQNGSQIFITPSTITKRRKKQKKDNVQLTTQEKLNKEKMELDSEKEVPIMLNCEGSPEAGFEKILKINQNDESPRSGRAGNLEDFVTPCQRKARNSTSQKGVESKILLDSLSGKKTTNVGSKSKLGRKGIISTTPDFKKIHEAQFKKMLSIDEYIERKNKMMCNFSNSVNEIKILTKKTPKTSQKENLNTNSKVRSSPRGLLLSPPSQKNWLSARGTSIKLRRSIRNSPGTANKSILSQKSFFGSTSLSTTKMNVRFSESTKDNEEKRSLIKTPSRKSSFLKNCTPDNQKSSECITSKDFKGEATKCQTTETSTNSAVTPFKFINQTVEPTSTKKPVFDLQASLSRPLTYQPHKGKLKPWGDPSKNHQKLYSHKKYYKEPPLQTREERREKHIQGRKQRKDQKLSTLRRLTVA